MKDAVGNEIVKGDILHVTLNSANVLCKVIEVSGGLVVDPQTRKVKPETVRVVVDITLQCPMPDLAIQFIPNAYKIQNPAKQVEEQARVDSVLEAASEKKTPELVPVSKFIKRPTDVKEENLNKTK